MKGVEHVVWRGEIDVDGTKKKIEIRQNPDKTKFKHPDFIIFAVPLTEMAEAAAEKGEPF